MSQQKRKFAQGKPEHTRPASLRKQPSTQSRKRSAGTTIPCPIAKFRNSFRRDPSFEKAFPYVLPGRRRWRQYYLKSLTRTSGLFPRRPFSRVAQLERDFGGLWHNTGCHVCHYCHSAAQCESPICSGRASRRDAEGI